MPRQMEKVLELHDSVLLLSFLSKEGIIRYRLSKYMYICSKDAYIVKTVKSQILHNRVS